MNRRPKCSVDLADAIASYGESGSVPYPVTVAADSWSLELRTQLVEAAERAVMAEPAVHVRTQIEVTVDAVLGSLAEARRTWIREGAEKAALAIEAEPHTLASETPMTYDRLRTWRAGCEAALARAAAIARQVAA
jgi:hypothetical protein